MNERSSRMYTKKLLKANITVKSMLAIYLMIIGILAFFCFFTFQSARSDLNDLLRRYDGNPPASEIKNIDVYAPTFFMVAAGAFGFGVAYLSQIYTLSLQMNVSRKNLFRASFISQLICAVVLTASYVTGKIGINYLFSLMSTGEYSPLAEKYREQAFNFSLFGEHGGNAATMTLAIFAICLCAALLGAVLMLVFSRYSGAKLVFIIAVPVIVFIAALVVCGLFRLKMAAVCFVAAVLVLMIYAQWRMIKTQSMEFSMTKPR